MGRMLRVAAVAVVLVGCGSAIENAPVEQEQEQALAAEGAAVMPGADLAQIPEGSLEFGAYHHYENGAEQLRWSESVYAPLFAGGKVVIRAHAARFPSCGLRGAVTAGIKLSGGELLDVALDDGDPTYALAGSTTLPLGTESIEVWIKSQDGDCVEYDSRDGANYRFEVARWAPALLQFRGDFTQAAAALVQGETLLVDYDIARLPNCRINYRGFPNWSIKVWARFSSGELYQKSIVRFDYSNTGSPQQSYQVLRAAFPVPRAAQHVQLWFENGQYPPTCQEWDSNYGNNYEFPVVAAPVVAPPVEQCADTERWEGATMSFPYCPDYSPALQHDANGCEFYVDGFGRGSFSNNGASASWLEAWLKVAPVQGEVVGAGMWTRFDAGERITFGVETEPGTWHSGITTARSVMGTGSFQAEPRAVAFFIDVKQVSGSVARLWLSRGGQNFDLADLYSVPGSVQSGGSNSIEWANESASLFDQKRVCGN